jgi:hypothetical protein
MALHCSHSDKNWQASVGMTSVLAWPHRGQVSMDSSTGSVVTCALSRDSPRRSSP